VREVEGVLLCTETFAFLLSDVDACILARGLPHSSKNRVRQSMSSCTQMSMSLCARGLMISVSRVLPSCSTPPPPPTRIDSHTTAVCSHKTRRRKYTACNHEWGHQWTKSGNWIGGSYPAALPPPDGKDPAAWRTLSQEFVVPLNADKGSVFVSLMVG
jgi:hypothetical protein